MKTSKGQLLLFLFLLLAATGAGGLAWKYYNRSLQLAAQLLSPDERAGQAKRIADYQAQIKKLSDRVAALRGRGGNDGDAAANADAGNRGGRQGRGNFGAAFRTVMNSPEFQKLQAVQAKATLDARYAALFKSLNLSSDQVAQLKNLLVARQQAATDALAAARDQGINPRTDPQDFQQAVQAAQASVDDQIKAALGDAGYAQYQQYEQTAPQRNVVSQLQTSLSYSSTPLTDDQANQMIQLLAQASAQPAGAASAGVGPGRARGGFGGLGGTGATVPITDQVLTQAQGVLSQPQIQALQQIQQQQQAQQQMQQLMRSAIQSANGGAAAAQ